jgi:uncharacterized phage protein gp47/JayE
MALSVPSTQTIADQIIAAVESEIGKSISLLPKSFTRVLSKALAGMWTITYKYAAWSHLQKYVAYASFAETEINGRKLRPLVEWGRLVGVGDPVAATNAQLTVQFGVLNADSSTLPAGTQLVHPSSGVIYITMTGVTLDASTKTVNVLAASDPDGNGGAGTLGNRNAGAGKTGDKLEFANPIAQLDAAGGAYVTAVVVTAANAETEAVYRARVIDRFAGRAEGGAASDYKAWAEEEPGIINTYVYTGDQPGVVDVCIEASVATSDEDGIPTTAQQDAVRDLIEADSSGLASRRPVSVVPYVWPISRQPFDVTITGLVAPDEAATKASISQALDDYFRGREPFILGLSKLPRLDRVTQSAVAGVVDETAAAFGATVTSVALLLNGASVNALTLGRGQKAKLGADPSYI